MGYNKARKFAAHSICVTGLFARLASPEFGEAEFLAHGYLS